MMINVGGDSHIGIPMDAIKYWQLEASRIAVAQPSVLTKPLQ